MPRVALVTAAVVGLAFPLVGVTFVEIALLDALAVQRLPALRAALA